MPSQSHTLLPALAQSSVNALLCDSRWQLRKSIACGVSQCQQCIGVCEMQYRCAQVMPMMSPAAEYSEAHPAAVLPASHPPPAESFLGGRPSPDRSHPPGDAVLGLDDSGSLPTGTPDFEPDCGNDILLSHLPGDSCDELLGEPRISIAEELPSIDNQSPTAVSSGTAPEQRQSQPHPPPLQHSSSPAPAVAASQSVQQQSGVQQLPCRTPSQPPQPAPAPQTLALASSSASAADADGGFQERLPRVPSQQGQAAAGQAATAKDPAGQTGAPPGNSQRTSSVLPPLVSGSGPGTRSVTGANCIGRLAMLDCDREQSNLDES